MSARIIGGEPYPTASPGEVLTVIDVVALAMQECPGSATAAAYAAMRALGVLRVDWQGEPFGIDVDMLAEQGDRSSGSIMAVERRWHRHDYPGGRRP